MSGFEAVLSLLPLSATVVEFVRVCGIARPKAIHVIARDGSLRSPMTSYSTGNPVLF